VVEEVKATAVNNSAKPSDDHTNAAGWASQPKSNPREAKAPAVTKAVVRPMRWGLAVRELYIPSSPAATPPALTQMHVKT
jgi:hypothetical protein